MELSVNDRIALELGQLVINAHERNATIENLEKKVKALEGDAAGAKVPTTGPVAVNAKPATNLTK